jgi:hypothetical protein
VSFVFGDQQRLQAAFAVLRHFGDGLSSYSDRYGPLVTDHEAVEFGVDDVVRIVALLWLPRRE